MEHSERKTSRIFPWAAGMVIGSLLLSLPVFDTAFQVNEIVKED